MRILTEQKKLHEVYKGVDLQPDSLESFLPRSFGHDFLVATIHKLVQIAVTIDQAELDTIDQISEQCLQQVIELYKEFWLQDKRETTDDIFKHWQKADFLVKRKIEQKWVELVINCIQS